VSGQRAPFALALDDASVFWTNLLGDVWRAPRSGAPGALAIAPSQAAGSIAVDADYVYWTTSVPSGSVIRAKKDGSSPTAIAPNQDTPSGIFVDDTDVYWTTYGDGSVMRMPKGSGSPVEIAKGQDHPNVVIADATYVYWTNAGPLSSTAVGSVSRALKNGSGALLLAVRTAPTDLAIDDTYVYWTSQGSAYRVPK
jgi:hypothetical protein